MNGHAYEYPDSFCECGVFFARPWVEYDQHLLEVSGGADQLPLAATMTPAISDVTIVADPPAERLRIRKGSTMRYTSGGKSWDYRVTDVSMPDEFGRCTVSVEPAP